MARIRTIKPELWSSERFGECSPSARLVFIASLNFADDAGNLDRSARQLKAQALPYDNGEAEPLVAELLRAGLLIEYKVGDKLYLHIKNFDVHQKIDKPSKSRLPLYDNSLRTQRQLAESAQSTRQKNPAEGKGREGKVSRVSIPSESHSDKSEVDRVFEFWKLTWNHPKASLDSKRSAAIKKALEGYSVEDLCAAIGGYLNSPHHTGQNDRQTVYDDIGLLLRDSAHIDAGIGFASKSNGLTSDLANHNVRVLQEWGKNASAGLEQISDDHGELSGSILKTAIPGH